MKKKNYPANLFHALGFDAGPENKITSNTMTPDQERGIEFIFESNLTPREHYIIQKFYQSMTEQELAEDLKITNKRVRQIRREALYKLKGSPLWAYAIDGYEVRTAYLTQLMTEQEKTYRILFPGISLDKNIAECPLPSRTVNALRRVGVTTVRELLSIISFAPVMLRIRNFGIHSYAETIRVLIQAGALPQDFEPMRRDICKDSLDCSVESLSYINMFSGQ